MAETAGTSSKRSRAIRLVMALAGSCMTIAAHAGGVDDGIVYSSISQPEVDHSFDSINFPIEAIAGQIDLNARGGWIWKEGETHRIVLDHDVDVTLAQHRFLAASANIWLRKVSSNPGSNSSRYQVYAIFEDMRSADGTITLKAKQFPVRGVIEVNDPISMKLAARFDEPPKSSSDVGDFVSRTNELFAQRVLGTSTPEETQAAARPWSTRQVQEHAEQSSATAAQVQDRDHAPVSPSQNGVQQATQADRTTGAEPNGPIFHPNGVFSVSIGGRIVIDGATSRKGSVITADGGVTIQYQDPASQQWLDFKAERVVIYTQGDEPITGVSRLGTNQIEGIYLEGGVFAGDDQWSIRSPRMYLDVARNRALMLDAVFWTTDQKSAMPLYVRAQSIRQTADDEFVAKKARISNTAFFEPDMTIGVSDITVSLEPTDNEQTTGNTRPNVTVEGKSVTLNAGGLPILWLPGFKGDPSSFPLRQISIGDSNRSGAAIRTRWNALSLLKIDDVPGLRVDLDLDYYSERGAAFGVTANWNARNHRGGLFSYLLANDDGTDVLSTGRRLERDGEHRGIFALHDVWEFTNAWTLVTELSYISDEAFVPALFDELGREREAFRTRLQLERLSDRTYLALEASAPINDFIAVEHQLQSPGYQVSKVPEARFVSLSKDLLPDYDPGLLTYSFEARVGVLRLNFSEVNAREYGFTTDTLADDAFGTTANSSLGDKFRALGLDESAVTRLDTRHELRARFDLGPINVVPFVAGRATAYDNSFDAFSPSQTDEVRYWGGGGVTLSTTIQKINNNAESRFFDVHRMRHIVEPSITVWGGDSNFDVTDTPIYDDDVEGLLKGTAVRAAVDQTWQTKRGGIGRWRDVDLFKLRTEYVWTSDRAGQSQIPDYYSARPELSNPGEYFGVSAVWQTTEVLAFAGEMVYDLEADRTARASIGAIIEHRPGFTTSIEYREVQPLDATFARLAARYRLSDKYEVDTSVNYNFDLGDFQTFNAQLLRRFQIGSLGATVSYNNIRGETSLGFVFRPSGSRGDIPIDSSWGG